MSEPKLSEESERLIADLLEARDDLPFGGPGSGPRYDLTFDALRARMAYLESRVAELEAEREWRPIETARMGDRVITADLDECRVWITIIGNPYMQQGQLWMPLPVLPTRAQAESAKEY